MECSYCFSLSEHISKNVSASSKNSDKIFYVGFQVFIGAVRVASDVLIVYRSRSNITHSAGKLLCPVFRQRLWNARADVRCIRCEIDRSVFRRDYKRTKEQGADTGRSVCEMIYGQNKPFGNRPMTRYVYINIWLPYKNIIPMGLYSEQQTETYRKKTFKNRDTLQTSLVDVITRARIGYIRFTFATGNKKQPTDNLLYHLRSNTSHFISLYVRWRTTHLKPP